MAAIWLLIKSFGGSAISAASGLSLKTWLKIAAVAAAALLVWLAYCWAWDRGAASQKADDQVTIDQKQARIDILAGDVLALQTGIDDRNRQIDAYAAAQRAAAAAAAKQAKDTLASFAEARKREVSRGNGPDAMNDFFRDILGGAQ